MREKLSLTFRVVLGIVFIISAYTKLISPGIVEIILVDHGIASSREIAAIYIRILIGLEFALGLMFFQPFYLKKIVLPASLIFLAGFTAYLFYTGYLQGDSQNCGCFGTVVNMSPFESTVKNAVLMIIAIVLYKILQPDKKNILVPIIIFIVAIPAVFVFSHIKNIKDFKFSNYTNFVGEGRVDLSEGEKLIIIVNTECEHCQKLTKELVKLEKTTKNFPEVFVLVFSEGDISIDSFKVITGFDFPYQMIDSRSFFDLIGSNPPRIYWLENGRIKEFWDEEFINKLSNPFHLETKG